MDQPIPSQAERIISRFGGMSRLSSALGHAHPTTVQGWKVSGFIHPKHYDAIWEAAKRLGVDIQPEDFTAFTPPQQTSAAE